MDVQAQEEPKSGAFLGSCWARWRTYHDPSTLAKGQRSANAHDPLSRQNNCPGDSTWIATGTAGEG